MNCKYCGKTLANNNEAMQHAGECPVMNSNMMKTKKASDLKVGDKVLTKHGHIETIKKIGKGWTPTRIWLDYKSGEWSTVDKNDEIELAE